MMPDAAPCQQSAAAAFDETGPTAPSAKVGGQEVSEGEGAR